MDDIVTNDILTNGGRFTSYMAVLCLLGTMTVSIFGMLYVLYFVVAAYVAWRFMCLWYCCYWQ